ncbi:MAG: sulfotransferase [Rivularia sp. (in: cyanobacteria)]
MKPNFFIVGAPRCGTTALSEYLRSHPNIYVSQPKEPHYFAADLDNCRFTKTLEEYLSLFKFADSSHMAIGEASVFLPLFIYRFKTNKRV